MLRSISKQSGEVRLSTYQHSCGVNPTGSDRGARGIAMSMSVCVFVFVCPRPYLRNYTSDLHRLFAHVAYGRFSVLHWRRSDTLCTSGFMDDVIVAHKPRLLDVAGQLKHSAHAASGLAIKCAQ